jgi:hypothetical protein
VLSVGKKRKTSFFFVFRSFIRTFGLRPRSASRRVTLATEGTQEGTSVRKNSNKSGFSLTYSYLWPSAEGTIIREKKKNKFFLCFPLVYSYLCSAFAKETW